MRVALLWLLVVLATGTVGAATDDTLIEKPFDKLSDRDVSEWGQAALKINAAKWQHGETKHFIIHFCKRGQKVATRSESFYAEIQEFFGNRPDLLAGRKSHIYAFHEEADWARFRNAIQMQNIGGVTRAHEFFYLATTADGQFDSKGRVQAHEMTHLVFNRFFRGTPPLWLNEGIAEYFGQRKTQSAADFRRLMSAAPNYSLDLLFAATAYPASQLDVQAFYAESAIVVDFLTHSADRRALLPKFVEVMIAANDLNRALTIYGYKDVADFQVAYQKFRKSRYK